LELSNGEVCKRHRNWVPVSPLSGQITAATTEDLRDANKAVKFAKMNNDVGLQFRPLDQISDMVWLQ
jgi:hypothetical protein